MFHCAVQLDESVPARPARSPSDQGRGLLSVALFPLWPLTPDPHLCLFMNHWFLFHLVYMIGIWGGNDYQTHLSSERYWTITQFNIYKIYFRCYILYICVLSTCQSPSWLFQGSFAFCQQHVAGGGHSGCSEMDILFFLLFFYLALTLSEEHRVAKCCLFLHKPNSFCLNKWKRLCFCLLYSLAQFCCSHHSATLTHTHTRQYTMTHCFKTACVQFLFHQRQIF